MITMLNVHYKIGELANKAGVSVETLRFYEAQSLLSPQRSLDSGYRVYSERDVLTVRFILHAKKVGFSLKEISILLNLKSDKDQHTCEEVKRYTGVKIGEIEEKIQHLEEIKSALQSLHQSCCGGSESAENCSILQTLENADVFPEKRNSN